VSDITIPITVLNVLAWCFARTLYKHPTRKRV